MIVNVLIGSSPMNQVIFFFNSSLAVCVCRSSLHRVSRFEPCYQCGTRATWYQDSTSQSRWWRQWRGWIVFFYFFKHAHYIPHNISAFFETYRCFSRSLIYFSHYFCLHLSLSPFSFLYIYYMYISKLVEIYLSLYICSLKKISRWESMINFIRSFIKPCTRTHIHIKCTHIGICFWGMQV